MSFLLSDIVSGLPAKGGGRQNWGLTADGSLGINAGVEAVLAIGESAELEELKYQTPIPPAVPLQMSVGNPFIPIATILGTIATNTNFPNFQTYGGLFTDVTDQYDGWIWFSGNGLPVSATNQSGRVLKYRRVPAVDMYTYGVSSNTNTIGIAPPAYYTRFGPYFQVGPAPNQAYSYFFRVKLKQPFPASGLASMPIFAPDSWKEVFQYDAIRRLAQNEGIQDTSIYKTAVDYLKTMGMDPWTLRQLQMQRDSKHNERQISMRTEVYTWR